MGRCWTRHPEYRERTAGAGSDDDDALQTYIQAGHLRHDDFLGCLVRLELTDLVALGFDEGVELLLGGHGCVGCVPSRFRRKEEETGGCLCVGCKGQCVSLARTFV